MSGKFAVTISMRTTYLQWPASLSVGRAWATTCHCPLLLSGAEDGSYPYTSPARLYADANILDQMVSDLSSSVGSTHTQVLLAAVFL